MRHGESELVKERNNIRNASLSDPEKVLLEAAFEIKLPCHRWIQEKDDHERHLGDYNLIICANICRWEAFKTFEVKEREYFEG